MTHVKFLNNGNFTNGIIPKHFSNLVDAFLTETLPNAETATDFRPRVDIIEKEKSFELHAILPGMEKENVTVEVEGNRLIISGERKEKVFNEGEKFHQVESLYGKFKRSFTLPKNVNTDSIKAVFKNGILEISIEKAEPAKSGKVIEIE